MATRKLRGKAPEEVRAGKPKMIVFGPPGTGKTTQAVDFPRCYFIDVEGGASRPQYQRRLLAGGGMYFGKDEGSQDFRTVIEEVKTLATVQHGYLSLVIDSFSKLYNLSAAEAEVRVGNDFGKDKKEAQRPTRQLLLWLERLDMNVVMVCHQADKWVKHGKELVNEGHKFDGWDKLEYDLDLMLHVTGKPSQARVAKSRVEEFPLDLSFPWAFAEFARRAGEGIMLRPPEVFKAATPEQVAKVQHLVGVLKVEDDWVAKCFAKAGVAAWAELSETAILACVKHLEAKMTAERTEPVED